VSEAAGNEETVSRIENDVEEPVDFLFGVNNVVALSPSKSIGVVGSQIFQSSDSPALSPAQLESEDVLAVRMGRCGPCEARPRHIDVGAHR